MWSRLFHAVEGRSIGRVIELTIKNLGYLIYGLSPQARRVRARDRTFDETWGTDTGGTQELGSLQLDRERARHGVRYQASDADHLLAVLDDFGIDFPSYTFIDFGCGKGRIILSAARRPFRAVCGVEFSRELAAVARKNARIFREEVEIVSSVQVVSADAAEFQLPRGNLVVYFYNPFDGPVMAKVVANLEAAVKESEREVKAIYVDPRCVEIIDLSGYWRKETRLGTLVFSARSLRR
jgi:SAM-dependent methyltransferase